MFLESKLFSATSPILKFHWRAAWTCIAQPWYTQVRICQRVSCNYLLLRSVRVLCTTESPHIQYRVVSIWFLSLDQNLWVLPANPYDCIECSLVWDLDGNTHVCACTRELVIINRRLIVFKVQRVFARFSFRIRTVYRYPCPRVRKQMRECSTHVTLPLASQCSCVVVCVAILTPLDSYIHPKLNTFTSLSLLPRSHLSHCSTPSPPHQMTPFLSLPTTCISPFYQSIRFLFLMLLKHPLIRLSSFATPFLPFPIQS